MSDLPYSRTGQGLPVVFIHGFCENRHMWGAFSKKLSKEYLVLSPDLPGFGESRLGKKDISLEWVADKISAWLQRINIESAVFIGHSLGGYVSLAIAEKYPEIVKGIGLFHSTAFADDTKKKESRDKTVTFIKKHGVTKFIDSFVPALFYQKRWKELKSTLQYVLEEGKKTSIDTIIAYTKAMRDRPDRFATWKNFPGQSLFISGTEDFRIPIPDCERHIEEKDSVDGYIIPETAHMGMYERPNETLQMIRDFLSKIH